MPKLTLSAMGKLVRDKRGARRLRDAAGEIGISPATLMRIENGRVPDVDTFAKVCRWLGIDPGQFLGFEAPPAGAVRSPSAEPPVRISAHFRAERLPKPETAAALARMLLFVAQREAERSSNDDADI
jgi:transcriptional regulator with XRE-family HTH domain